jgi:hypothetical protein
MDRVYDIFERLPDGSLMWRGRVAGLELAKGKLRDLASKSDNEFHALYSPTKEIVARVNVGGAGG